MPNGGLKFFVTNRSLDFVRSKETDFNVLLSCFEKKSPTFPLFLVAKTHLWHLSNLIHSIRA